MQMNEQELRDMDATIAERIFGFVWLERWNEHTNCYLKALFGPEPWQKWNFRAADWKPANPETKRFSDWDRATSLEDPKDSRKHLCIGVPRYTSGNSPDTLKVLKWCYKNVGRGAICTRETQDSVQIWVNNGGVFGAAVEAPTLEIAICKLALELAGRGK